ncbi:hypothetical protein [Pseudomonas sp. JG-B]|uniref:hypothetical protein n=1 Tax=Pseudomonas sp. JG-B TaxID=2603214 RepID=UPI00129E921F|nr:hypothetical protein [Pseudomonas sp. JG-B]MRK19116.1 hypothetical protein [Pseudomonas sp. JG-B]
MARMYLVPEGDNAPTLIEVAKQFGMSKQAVDIASRIVWTVYEEKYQKAKAAASNPRAIPEGWEEVVLVAPKELVREFRVRLAEYQQSNAQDAAKEPALKKPRAPKRTAKP